MKLETFEFGKAKAVFSYRDGGVSKANYSSLNVSDYVGDSDDNVTKNRDLLAEKLQPELSRDIGEWYWPTQKHSKQIFELKDNLPHTLPSFDYEIPRKGSFRRKDFSDFIPELGNKLINDPNECCDGVMTREVNTPCIIQTADCLPIAILSKNKVASIHAGWQGIKRGIVRKAFDYFKEEKERGEEIKVFLGPCIRVESNEFSFSDALRIEKSLPFKIRNVIFNIDDTRIKCFLDLPLIIQRHCEYYGYDFTDAGVDTMDSPDCFSYRGENRTGRHALVTWIND
mgnify:FL=1|jgi:copper oxidase (laccase) domain-containing protein